MDIVHRSFEALARGDFEAAFAEHDEDIEWRTAADEPDHRVYRGVEGLRTLVASLAEPWADRFDDSVEFEDFIARGPWVVVPWTAVLHGTGSGLEIEVTETYAVLVRERRRSCESRNTGRLRRRFAPWAPRRWAAQTSARPTESATQQGFSEPSTSTVQRCTTCHQPPPTSSTETVSTEARTRAPAGTGAGKRTLFQP